MLFLEMLSLAQKISDWVDSLSGSVSIVNRFNPGAQDVISLRLLLAYLLELENHILPFPAVRK
jgi:hypothetical protein